MTVTITISFSNYCQYKLKLTKVGTKKKQFNITNTLLTTVYKFVTLSTKNINFIDSHVALNV